MSGFDPASFLDTVQVQLPMARSDADHRTIAGRAYYAAYGVLRARLCAAKDESPARMFGRAGRHADLARAMSVAGVEFKSMVRAYLRLRSRRVVSDYDYQETLTRVEAQKAYDDARWIVLRLRRIGDRSFRAFPLRPLNRP